MKISYKLIISLFIAIGIVIIILLFALNPESISFTEIKKSLVFNSVEKNMAKIEKEYEENIKIYFSELSDIMNSVESDIIPTDNPASATSTDPIAVDALQKELIDKIDDLKARAMDLLVPENYKDFHIQNIILLDKLKSYIATKNAEFLDESVNMSNKLKNDFDLLIKN